MQKVYSNYDFQNSHLDNKLLYNATEQKLYRIVKYTQSTVHVFEYPLIFSREISNDVVFASMGCRVGYLKWSPIDIIGLPILQKKRMSCQSTSQYLIIDSDFMFNNYLKLVKNNTGDVVFESFVEDFESDVQKIWLNRDVINLISTYRLYNAPGATPQSKAYYETYIDECLKTTVLIPYILE